MALALPLSIKVGELSSHLGAVIVLSSTTSFKSVLAKNLSTSLLLSYSDGYLTGSGALKKSLNFPDEAESSFLISILVCLGVVIISLSFLLDLI
jgi:hypothetical protein